MPPQQNKPAPDFIPASTSPDFIPAGGGQGSSPDYGPDTTVVNPTMGQIGKGVLREGAQLASGAHSIGSSVINAIPGVKNSRFGTAMAAHQAILDEASKPQNIGEAMGKTGAQMASYLAPAKLESSAAEIAPEALRPLARIGTSALSNGTMNKMNGGDFSTGAETGAGFGALSEGARAFLAPALMRSAIPGNIGKDSANALLSETRGVRPSTVLKNTEGRIGQASSDLDASVAASPNARISLMPATRPVQAALDIAGKQRVPGDTAEIQRLMDFLHGQQEFGPARGGTMNPQALSLNAQDALDARRGLAKNFVSNRQWKQVTNDAPQAAAKQAYGAVSGELHNQVPGTTEADDLIHNLKPAQAGLRSLVQKDPSIVGNVAGRVGARTGALTAATVGAEAGARRGLGGALLGGGLGLVAPEVLSSPAAKIGMSRMAYSTLTPKIGRAVATPAIQKLIDALRQQRTGDQAQ